MPCSAPLQDRQTPTRRARPEAARRARGHMRYCVWPLPCCLLASPPLLAAPPGWVVSVSLCTRSSAVSRSAPGQRHVTLWAGSLLAGPVAYPYSSESCRDRLSTRRRGGWGGRAGELGEVSRVVWSARDIRADSR